MQDYWLPTPFASFPFTSPPVRHRVPSHSDSASNLQYCNDCNKEQVNRTALAKRLENIKGEWCVIFDAGTKRKNIVNTMTVASNVLD